MALAVVAADSAAVDDFAWLTSHTFPKTTATILDDAVQSARKIADQLGHANPSMTQDVYMGRGVRNPEAAAALNQVLEAAMAKTAPSGVKNPRSEAE